MHSPALHTPQPCTLPTPAHSPARHTPSSPDEGAAHSADQITSGTRGTGCHTKPSKVTYSLHCHLYGTLSISPLRRSVKNSPHWAPRCYIPRLRPALSMQPINSEQAIRRHFLDSITTLRCFVVQFDLCSGSWEKGMRTTATLGPSLFLNLTTSQIRRLASRVRNAPFSVNITKSIKEGQWKYLEGGF